MKIEVNVRKSFFVYALLGILLLISAGFGFAQWDTSNIVYHDASDIRINIEGTDYGLEEYISILKEDLASGDDSEDNLETYDRIAMGELYFGGMYSTGQYGKGVNVLTEGYSCPSGYKSASLMDGGYVILCYGIPGEVEKVANFGGMYGYQQANPLTGSRSCPSGYETASQIASYTQFYYCYDTDLENSVIDYFGGMYGDSFKNPSTLTTECPLGYETSSTWARYSPWPTVGFCYYE